MGVKELVVSARRLVEEMEPERMSKIFVCRESVPETCTVSISEIMLKFFKYASLTEAMPVDKLFEWMLGEYVRMARRSSMQCIIVVGDDARYVPYAKLAEQRRRILQRTIPQYEDCWRLRFPVTEERLPDGRIVVTRESGALVNDAHATNGLPSVLSTIIPNRFVTTRRLREPMMEALFLFTKHYDWPDSPHLQIYWDMGGSDVRRIWMEHTRREDPTTGLHYTICTPMSESLPGLNNGIGEGELKLVWWLTRGILKVRRMAARDAPNRQGRGSRLVEDVLRARKAAAAAAASATTGGGGGIGRRAFEIGSGIHVKTKDQDAFLSMMSELVSGPLAQSGGLEPLGPIYWQNDTLSYIDVWELTRFFLRHHWDVPRFTIACAMSETDYTTKKLTSHQIGSAPSWNAWFAWMPHLPTFPAIRWHREDDDRAPDPESEARDAVASFPASEMLQTFDAMIRALYTEYIRPGRAGKGGALLTWKQIMATHAAGHIKKLTPKRPCTVEYHTAWAEFCYFWLYTQTLGRCQSDILMFRGTRNETSEDARVLRALIVYDADADLLSCRGGDVRPAPTASNSNLDHKHAKPTPPPPSPARPLRATPMLADIEEDGDPDGEIQAAIADLKPAPPAPPPTSEWSPTLDGGVRYKAKRPRRSVNPFAVPALASAPSQKRRPRPLPLREVASGSGSGSGAGAAPVSASAVPWSKKTTDKPAHWRDPATVIEIPAPRPATASAPSATPVRREPAPPSNNALLSYLMMDDVSVLDQY